MINGRLYKEPEYTKLSPKLQEIDKSKLLRFSKTGVDNFSTD